MKQKENKHQRTKSIKKTGTAGSRAKSRPKHGSGKNSLKYRGNKKGRR